MKVPRVSIADLMALVIVVAAECGAIRALVGSSSRPAGSSSELIAYGALPMAGLLVVGLLAMIRDRRRRAPVRPFLAGFELVGWAALLVFLAGALLFPDPIVELIVDEVVLPLADLLEVGDYDPNPPLEAIVEFLVVATILVPPQLVPALIGGWLLTRFRVTIRVERRRPAEGGRQ